MARAAFEAIKETARGSTSWTLASTSAYAPRPDLTLKNHGNARNELEALLRNLHAKFLVAPEDVPPECTLPPAEGPPANLKSSPCASTLTPPLPWTLEIASKKLERRPDKKVEVEVAKPEEDLIKSDVTTKTSPVSTSPLTKLDLCGSIVPEIVEVNECVFNNSFADAFLDTQGKDTESSSQPGATVSRSSTIGVAVEEPVASGLKSRGRKKHSMMRRAGRAPADYVTSSDDELEEITFVDSYCMYAENVIDTPASLLDLPYEGGHALRESSLVQVFDVHGTTDRGNRPFFSCVDQWRVRPFVNSKPQFEVKKVAGSWMEIGSPCKLYAPYMRVILIAAYLLSFAKRHPNDSRTAAWKYVLKEMSSFHFKVNSVEEDLDEALPLVRKILSSASRLEKAPIMRELFPALWKQGRSVDEKSQGSEGQTLRGTTKRERVREDQPVRNCNPKLNDEPGKKKMRYALHDANSDDCQDDNLHSKSSESEEWVDEPDVCMFCDDGVGEGDKLLCCDGGCMRSFHVTKKSGMDTSCESLNLTEAALKEDGYVCPNCKYKQHQCFACNKLGRSQKTATGAQEVFCCSAKRCKRYYHLDCMATLLGRKDKVPEKFFCPLHKCQECGKGADKRNQLWGLIKCRRCPRAWHQKCWPSNMVLDKNIWKVGDGVFVFYCDRHTIDKKLSTPIRDHIKFPPTPAHVPIPSADSPNIAGPSWVATGTPIKKSSARKNKGVRLTGFSKS